MHNELSRILERPAVCQCGGFRGIQGDPICADPEQMVASAIASCHMLFFLAIAEFPDCRVEQYEDSAAGHLEKAKGVGMSIAHIELSPKFTNATRHCLLPHHTHCLNSTC